MLEILSEVDIDVGEVYAVASRRSLGREVSFGDRTLKCQDLETFDFSKVDIALMSAAALCPRNGRPRSQPKARLSSTIVRPGVWTRTCR